MHDTTRDKASTTPDKVFKNNQTESKTADKVFKKTIRHISDYMSTASHRRSPRTPAQINASYKEKIRRGGIKGGK